MGKDQVLKCVLSTSDLRARSALLVERRRVRREEETYINTKKYTTTIL